eukprot:5657152-Amphidinium_carterae.1
MLLEVQQELRPMVMKNTEFKWYVLSKRLPQDLVACAGQALGSGKSSGLYFSCDVRRWWAHRQHVWDRCPRSPYLTLRLGQRIPGISDQATQT